MKNKKQKSKKKSFWSTNWDKQGNHEREEPFRCQFCNMSFSLWGIKKLQKRHPKKKIPLHVNTVWKLLPPNIVKSTRVHFLNSISCPIASSDNQLEGWTLNKLTKSIILYLIEHERHQLHHTGEWPFKCLFCTKAFPD